MANALHASHYRLADLYVAFGYVVATGGFGGRQRVRFQLANVDAAGNVAAQAASQTLLRDQQWLNTGGDVIYNSVGGQAVPPGRVIDQPHGRRAGRPAVPARPGAGTNAVTDLAHRHQAASSQRVRSGIAEVLLSGEPARQAGSSDPGHSDAGAGESRLARLHRVQLEETPPAAALLRGRQRQPLPLSCPMPRAAALQGYDRCSSRCTITSSTAWT
jgi:hydroxybutyrate-dimer hydrolase